MIEGSDWDAIMNHVAKVVNKHGREIDQVVVNKRDTKRRVVFADEYGDQPIPLLAFDYEIDYYDTTASGVRKRKLIVKPAVPHVGDTILVARHLGSSRLPKCIGKIQSRDFVDPTLLED